MASISGQTFVYNECNGKLIAKEDTKIVCPINVSVKGNPPYVIRRKNNGNQWPVTGSDIDVLNILIKQLGISEDMVHFNFEKGWMYRDPKTKQFGGTIGSVSLGHKTKN